MFQKLSYGDCDGDDDGNQKERAITSNSLDGWRAGGRRAVLQWE